MDTLPEEVVELIAQHLSPLDMTRCSAVSRSWYGVFNVDRLWKRHCDVDLEEPLQVIPNVATPSFDLSATEDSTLPPTSYWKMVYFREKRLWKSWRTTENTHQLDEENIIKCDNENPLEVDFLTDTLIVAWYSHHIEILDVSLKPAVIAAKTDIGERIYADDRCCVASHNILIVEKPYSILIFEVDIINKSMKLKYNFLFKTEFSSHISLKLRRGCFAKENLYLYAEDGSRLKILDLNTGKLVKDDPCPVKMDQNVRVTIGYIKSSPTSDFVAVVFHLDSKEETIFIYNLNQLTFLPNSQITLQKVAIQNVALHENWVAVRDSFSLNVFNISATGEVILSNKVSDSNLHWMQVCNGSFVFKTYKPKFGLNTKSHIAIYFPASKTWKLTESRPSASKFQIVNDKILAVFDMSLNSVSSVSWKLSGGEVEKCDFSVLNHCKINRSFTKGIKRMVDPETGSGNCWYVIHKW